MSSIVYPKRLWLRPTTSKVLAASSLAKPKVPFSKEASCMGVDLSGGELAR